MQTEESDSTIEATKIFVKIISSTYAKADLKKFSTAAFHIDKISRKMY